MTRHLNIWVGADNGPRYGCRACEGAVVQAPAPARPIEGGLPTTALLAHVAAAKFAWHLPLNPQAQMLAGRGARRRGRPRRSQRVSAG